MRAIIIPILVATLLVFGSCEKDYTDFVNSIKQLIEDPNKPFRHSAWERLAYITDTWGPRMWGSEVLEQVIREMLRQAKEEGFENIKL